MEKKEVEENKVGKTILAGDFQGSFDNWRSVGLGRTLDEELGISFGLQMPLMKKLRKLERFSCMPNTLGSVDH